jgi:hypothetical protein
MRHSFCASLAVRSLPPRVRDLGHWLSLVTDLRFAAAPLPVLRGASARTVVVPAIAVRADQARDAAVAAEKSP